MQRWRKLAKVKTIVNPKAQFLEDLTTFITAATADQTEVLVMLDANADMTDLGFSTFMLECGLQDLHDNCDMVPHLRHITGVRGRLISAWALLALQMLWHMLGLHHLKVVQNTVTIEHYLLTSMKSCCSHPRELIPQHAKDMACASKANWYCRNIEKSFSPSYLHTMFFACVKSLWEIPVGADTLILQTELEAVDQWNHYSPFTGREMYCHKIIQLCMSPPPLLWQDSCITLWRNFIWPAKHQQDLFSLYCPLVNFTHQGIGHPGLSL